MPRYIFVYKCECVYRKKKEWPSEWAGETRKQKADCQRAILQYHDSATLCFKHFTIPRPPHAYIHTNGHTKHRRWFENKRLDVCCFCFVLIYSISFRFFDSALVFFRAVGHRHHTRTPKICMCVYINKHACAHGPCTFETGSRIFYFLLYPS